MPLKECALIRFCWILVCWRSWGIRELSRPPEEGGIDKLYHVCPHFTSRHLTSLYSQTDRILTFFGWLLQLCWRSSLRDKVRCIHQHLCRGENFADRRGIDFLSAAHPSDFLHIPFLNDLVFWRLRAKYYWKVTNLFHYTGRLFQLVSFCPPYPRCSSEELWPVVWWQPSAVLWPRPQTSWLGGIF